MSVKTKTQAMIGTIYFGQADFYYSESKQEAVAIDSMHRTHAANAAEKLLTDAYTWAGEAGVLRPMSGMDNEKLSRMWMLSTPLHRALVNRAVGVC